MIVERYQFCPQCGTPLIDSVRFGKPRQACPACDWVYFADPKVAAGVLVERDGQVLLVRRANEPGRGLWTLPAGFVDAGEDPALAAQRECLEEAGVEVRITSLVDVLYGQEHPRGAHIVIFYRAEIVAGSLTPGDDVDGVSFFPRSSLPPLAFTTTRRILERAS